MTNEIKVILDGNSYITEEVKENLMELIELFNKKFPDIDLTGLNERLKSLIIRRESMFLVKLPCQYNPHTNEILINLGRFEDCDARHWMMHCLLGIITAKDNYYGFNNEDDKLVALNEGYTEIVTNYLVGDIEDNFYFDEVVVTNLISKIIGEDVLFDAYFSNDSNKVIDAMIKAEEN